MWHARTNGRLNDLPEGRVPAEVGIINAARFYGVPPWHYAALASGESVEVFTTPAAMVMWSDWASIIKAAEQELSVPPERTSETF